MRIQTVVQRDSLVLSSMSPDNDDCFLPLLVSLHTLHINLIAESAPTEHTLKQGCVCACMHATHPWEGAGLETAEVWEVLASSSVSVLSTE